MDKKISFDRESISPMDQNPWKDTKVDQIYDTGLQTESGYRIGIIEEELSNEDQKLKLMILCSTIEQIIREQSGEEIHVKLSPL